MHAPLLFNVLFKAVINVACKHFKVDKNIMDALVHLWNKTEARGQRGSNHWRATPSDVALGHTLR